MPSLMMNTVPELYLREWWDPDHGSELYIPPAHPDSPYLLQNGHRQPDRIIRTLPIPAQNILNNFMAQAIQAIRTRPRLEAYFAGEFDPENGYQHYEKVVLGFLSLTNEMRFGLQEFHMQLCRLLVARACCENHMPQAKKLASMARLVHGPLYWSFTSKTVPCPKFDHADAALLRENGRPGMSDSAHSIRFSILLDHFYELMDLNAPCHKQMGTVPAGPRSRRRPRPRGVKGEDEEEEVTDDAPPAKKARLSAGPKSDSASASASAPASASASASASSSASSSTSVSDPGSDSDAKTTKDEEDADWLQARYVMYYSEYTKNGAQLNREAIEALDAERKEAMAAMKHNIEAEKKARTEALRRMMADDAAVNNVPRKEVKVEEEEEESVKEVKNGKPLTKAKPKRRGRAADKRDRKEKEKMKKEVKQKDDEDEDEQDEDHINWVLNTGRPRPRTGAPAIYETPAQLRAREPAQRKELREQKMLLSQFPNLRS